MRRVAHPDGGSGKKSGKVRAHQGGDRQANSALWRIVTVHIAHDQRTQLYFERRVKEGRTKHEAIRILKRYVAREVYGPWAQPVSASSSSSFSHGLSQPKVSRRQPFSLRSISWRSAAL